MWPLQLTKRQTICYIELLKEALLWVHEHYFFSILWQTEQSAPVIFPRTVDCFLFNLSLFLKHLQCRLCSSSLTLKKFYQNCFSPVVQYSVEVQFSSVYNKCLCWNLLPREDNRSACKESRTCKLFLTTCTAHSITVI